MQVATYVYQKFLCSRGIARMLWRFLRQVLIRIAKDPTCVLSIHERQLKIPLSHALPMYLEAHEHYDRLPGRISAYLRHTQGSLKCIDVGANIGDSVAAFYKEDKDLFLAIEPNPNFHRYLVANWGWNQNVKVIDTICSSGTFTGNFAIKETAGTASISEAASGIVMNAQSLDRIIDNIPEFKDANLLKVDTDGHDFEVIFGAADLISSNRPAILFECDDFGSDRYLEECLRVLRLFKSSGYNYCLVYDNFGYLMGRYSLEDLSAVRRLIFYQLTSPFYYFDILVMNDADIAMFYTREVDYFINRMTDKMLKSEALAAAEV